MIKRPCLSIRHNFFDKNRVFSSESTGVPCTRSPYPFLDNIITYSHSTRLLRSKRYRAVLLSSCSRENTLPLAGTNVPGDAFSREVQLAGSTCSFLWRSDWKTIFQRPPGSLNAKVHLFVSYDLFNVFTSLIMYAINMDTTDRVPFCRQHFLQISTLVSLLCTARDSMVSTFHVAVALVTTLRSAYAVQRNVSQYSTGNL